MSTVRYKTTFSSVRKVIKLILSAAYPIIRRFYLFPKVMSIEETIDHIVANRSSISRYGDNEFLIITDKIDLPFQSFDEELRQRMIEILRSDQPGHLVGLPIGYHSLENLIPDSKVFWRSQIAWVYPRLIKYFDLSKIYYNASMTRVYVTFDDKKDCSRIFQKLMMIWENREVLLIEGEKSRLGVGNNLFDNTLSVQRILAPMHHAFSRYTDILHAAKKYSKSKLILLALGPTATVLAYDLAKQGFQAVDIGNVDIEYEWFLRGATTKVKIPGKYTSEAAGGRSVEDLFDDRYNQEIVERIL